jgi:MSHA biogenesis protein MshO
VRRGSLAQSGFSLVELIVVIVVIGVLAGSVAVFINNPVRAYFDAQRRTTLTDTADAALRRIGRDLQGALPNSVRVTSAGGSVWIEFVPIAAAGRYRAAAAATSEPAGIDPLDFADPADASFQVLGPAVEVPPGAQLVIFNVGAGELDVHGGGNRRQVTTPAGPATSIAFVPNGGWPADSPDHRFFLVTHPVTYGCTPAADGSGRIERFDGYAFAATQPTAAALAGASRSLLVDGVVNCSFELNGVLANANGVSLAIVLGNAQESVRLLSQLHLPNTP